MTKGFARLKETRPQLHREICSKGGKAAHLAGCHEFTSEEAKVASAKAHAASRTLEMFPCGEEAIHPELGRVFVCSLDRGHPGPHRDRSGDSWEGSVA